MFKKPCPCGCGVKVSKDAAQGMLLVLMVRDFGKLLRDAANVADTDSERAGLLAIRDEGLELASHAELVFHGLSNDVEGIGDAAAWLAKADLAIQKSL